MPMASNGLHRKRDHNGVKPMLWEAELTIAVASAVPMAAIIALALGCYIGLSVPGMLAVTFLFTALLTIYAVTVRALCLEYSGARRDSSSTSATGTATTRPTATR